MPRKRSLPGHKLGPKEAQFVAEFLVDLNATQAAIRAGYSKRTARNIAADVMTRPRVAAAIAEAAEGKLARTGITADRVMRELAAIAFADARDLYQEDGQTLRPIQDWTDQDGASVAAIETTRRNLDAADGIVDLVVKIRRWDKLRALEMLARHFKLLTDEIDLKHGGEVVVRWKRRDER